MKKIATAGLVLLFIASAAYYLIQSKRTTVITSKSDEAEGPFIENTRAPSETNSVAISDYTPGQTVTLYTVVLEKPGYVMIHEDDGSGKPGAGIGNSPLLPAGESSNVKVALLRPSVDGETLYAMLHTDDGDGVFGFPGPDAPLKDKQGDIIMMNYTVGP